MQVSAVCAVVVTYNPDIGVLKQLLAALEPQVAQLVVVDNGSTDQVTLAEVAGGKIGFLPLASNFGVAHAHNQGINWARDANADAVLLMDQDSIPAPDMVEQLQTGLNQLQKEGQKVGAVGACYFGSEEDNESFFVRFGWFRFQRQYCSECELGQELVAADFLISSGSLIPLDAIDAVGEMDERLFIDHVDTDWFLRASYQGYQAFGNCRALMRHGLGERTLKVWLGRTRHVPQHKPFRYYYIFRNSVLLYRRSYAPIKWIINDLWRLAGIGVLYAFFCSPRWENAKMILRGIRDGLRGATGHVISPGKA